MLLSLEVVLTQIDSGVDCDAFNHQLEEVIRSVHLIDTNHRLIMYYIQKLRIHSHQHALTCLKIYVLQRLIPEKKSDWVEQAVINYLSMCSNIQDTQSTGNLQQLEQDLNLFANALKEDLHPNAAQAAHIIV